MAAGLTRSVGMTFPSTIRTRRLQMAICSSPAPPRPISLPVSRSSARIEERITSITRFSFSSETPCEHEPAAHRDGDEEQHREDQRHDERADLAEEVLRFERAVPAQGQGRDVHRPPDPLPQRRIEPVREEPLHDELPDQVVARRLPRPHHPLLLVGGDPAGREVIGRKLEQAGDLLRLQRSLPGLEGRVGAQDQAVRPRERALEGHGGVLPGELLLRSSSSCGGGGGVNSSSFSSFSAPERSTTPTVRVSASFFATIIAGTRETPRMRTPNRGIPSVEIRYEGLRTVVTNSRRATTPTLLFTTPLPSPP